MPRLIKIFCCVQCAFLFILLFCACSVEARDEVPPRYTITARVDVQQKKIHAVQQVTYINSTDAELSELFFHVYPNRTYSKDEKEFINQFGAYFKVNFFPEGFQSGAIDIALIEVNGASVNPVFEGTDRTILKSP